MINLIALIIIILTTASCISGVIGIYSLTNIGYSLIFLSFFLFTIVCILGYLSRNQSG